VLKIFDQTVRSSDSEQQTNDCNPYQQCIFKILKVYKIIAESFCEWRYINDILQALCYGEDADADSNANANSADKGSLLAFKCSMRKSQFVQMVRMLLKCVNIRNDLEQMERAKNGHGSPAEDANQAKRARKQKSEEMARIRRRLLDNAPTLFIPGSVQWLSISNMECKIDVSRCNKLIGIQFHNIRNKQVSFPLYHVIPAIACSTDTHQIYIDWLSHLNLAFTDYTLEEDEEELSALNVKISVKNKMKMRPPARFLFFNGELTPQFVEQESNTNENGLFHRDKNIQQILNMKDETVPKVIALLKQFQVLRNKHSKQRKGNKKKQAVADDDEKEIEAESVRSPGDTNRDQEYLCLHLHESEREDLFVKLVTFYLQLLYDEEAKWHPLVNQKVDSFQAWWSNYESATWIRDFGKNVQYEMQILDDQDLST